MCRDVEGIVVAHIFVIGAGLGGLPTAYELRRLVPHHHQVTLVSSTSQFTFIPSLPWVALNLIPLERIQLSVGDRVQQRGINWIPEAVTGLNPQTQEISLGSRTLTYDHVVIATGAELNLACIPGLGPETGYTQSALY